MAKITTHIIAFLAFTLLLSSCINLRYTNYGKPFDFLSAKNHNYKIKYAEQDTAAVSNKTITEKPNAPGAQVEKSHEIIVPDNSDIVDAGDNEITNNSRASFRESNNLPLADELQKTSRTAHSKKTTFISGDMAITITPWPPEWWQNMWSNFWSWVLKWLLIILIFIVVLALVIWGIYALISVLAGPAVAGIVVCCIILLLYLLIEFS